MPATGSKSSGRLQYELLDETLDLNKTQFYHLSIQVSLDGFLFAILDPAGSRYIGLKSYQFDRVPNPDKQLDEIKAIMDQDPFLQRPYQGVSCIYNEARSTLLPAALFEREQLRLYFEFNHLLNDLDELHYNHLKQVDAYMVFPIYSEIANLLLERWLNTEFFHQATPFVDSIISLDNPGRKIAGINFNEGYFDIIVVENKKLVYHNIFSYRSDEDLLYFVLFVFDKMGLEQETTPVLVSGNIDKFSEQPPLMKKYLRKLSFQDAPSGFKYPPSFHKIQGHSLLSLLGIYHCA
ncbi:DUF3822 family protein [Bacteroidota bacterium]